ncbi:MAG: dephospho-CoA kinase [Acidobacteriaceae bacterium]|nr:dephospho-CoA kinase [Acidobacteriaceae bacterium]
MLRVGLTGGLASGKSFVGRSLASMGAHLIQADEIGHEVLDRHGSAYPAVVEQFGAGVLDTGGNIDRRKLAAVVFNDSDKLQRLTGIVHPAVLKREQEMMDEIARTDPQGIAVVEAAILVETGSYRKYDRLILVVCSPEQQMERAMHRDSYTREEVTARLQRQLPLEEKKRLAHYIIDTSGTKENTVEQTRAVYNDLLRLNL